MRGYVEITQDGIGRISRANTPPEILGFFTDGIETCVIIIIASQKGLSLIHTTGCISADTIEAEFRWHEKIDYWTMAYNPEFYPNKNYKKAIGLCAGYFVDQVNKVLSLLNIKKEPDGETIKVYEASQGFLAISKTGDINVHVKLPDQIVVMYEDKQIRHKVNQANCYFLHENEYHPGDFQFDEVKFTPVPPLFKTIEEIEAMAKSPRFSSFKDNLIYLGAYYTAYQFQSVGNILKESIANLLAQNKSEEGNQAVTEAGNVIEKMSNSSESLDEGEEGDCDSSQGYSLLRY